MKPTSIIFLVLSVILVIAGCITCGVAKGMAAKDGIELFEETVDDFGNTVYRVDIGNDNYSKIDLEISDGDVNIIGGSAESYIEVINFKANTYTLSTAGSTVSFRDSISILSLFTSTEGNIGFKGMRYFFTGGGKSGEGRKVNVYLASDYDMTSMNVSVRNGNLSVSDLETTADYKISAENGTAKFINVRNSSDFQYTGNKGKLILENTIFRNLEAYVEESDIEIRTAIYDQTSFEINAENGAVYVNGENKGDVFSMTSASLSSTVNAQMKKGNVIIDTIR